MNIFLEISVRKNSTKSILWKETMGSINLELTKTLRNSRSIKKEEPVWYQKSFSVYFDRCQFCAFLYYIPDFCNSYAYFSINIMSSLPSARAKRSLYLVLDFASSWKLYTSGCLASLIGWRNTVMLSQYGQFFILWYKMRSLWQAKSTLKILLAS